MKRAITRTAAFLAAAMCMSMTPAAEKPKKQNFTGWIDTSSRPIDREIGNFRFRAKPKLGSFNIAAVNSDGKSVNLISPINEFTTSSFYLMAGRKIYKLTAGQNVSSDAHGTENGIQLRYTIPGTAEVTVDFSCFASPGRTDEDMIKVTATVTNRGQRSQTFALKCVLDTVLGETDRFHFYTSENAPVKSETIFRTMKNEKWFISRNSQAALQILLDGADITAPETVALANYSTLDTQNWEPDMLSYRTFDTVLSYNNSAAGITWPKTTLGKGKSDSAVFYMAAATDGAVPAGMNFIDGIQPETPMDEAPPQQQTEFPPAEPETPVAAQKEEVRPQVDFTVPDVKFDVNSLSKEQLSPEYIQNLLNRIASLEDSGEAVNRNELLQLNAELDAILEYLRKN